MRMKKFEGHTVLVAGLFTSQLIAAGSVSAGSPRWHDISSLRRCQQDENFTEMTSMEPIVTGGAERQFCLATDADRKAASGNLQACDSPSSAINYLVSADQLEIWQRSDNTQQFQLECYQLD